MTPEEKSLLERTHALAVENNHILHSLRRSDRLSLVFRIFYWVVILVVSFGSYVVIQPFLKSFINASAMSQTGPLEASQAINQIKAMLPK